eukprot:COSAG02_NODE_11404_length_1730_cov_1.623544_2_plen_172_part_00
MRLVLAIARFVDRSLAPVSCRTWHHGASAMGGAGAHIREPHSVIVTRTPNHHSTNCHCANGAPDPTAAEVAAVSHGQPLQRLPPPQSPVPSEESGNAAHLCGIPAPTPPAHPMPSPRTLVHSAALPWPLPERAGASPPSTGGTPYYMVACTRPPGSRRKHMVVASRAATAI